MRVAIHEKIFRKSMALDVESHVAAQCLLGNSELILHLLVEGAEWRVEYFRRMMAWSLVYIFSSSSDCIYKLTINTKGDYPTPSYTIYQAKSSFFIET